MSILIRLDRSLIEDTKKEFPAVAKQVLIFCR